MWRQLVIDSLIRPRVAARGVFALNLAPDLLVQAAVAVTAAEMVLGFLALRLTPGAVDSLSAVILGDPLLGAAVQLGVLAVTVVLTWRVGRLFGGSGSLSDALALVVWLNAMMVLIQAVQLVTLAVLPPAALLLATATAFWALWAYASFVAELHGFQNPFLVLGGVLLTLLVLFFTLGMIVALIGIVPQEAS
jgi:hypothetical protein